MSENNDRVRSLLAASVESLETAKGLGAQSQNHFGEILPEIANFIKKCEDNIDYLHKLLIQIENPEIDFNKKYLNWCGFD